MAVVMTVAVITSAHTYIHTYHCNTQTFEQLFDDDFDFSGSDSDGEKGEDGYAYRGPTLSASTWRDEETLESMFSGKCFYSESALYLLLARQS